MNHCLDYVPASATPFRVPFFRDTLDTDLSLFNSIFDLPRIVMRLIGYASELFVTS